jgi:hypothetical protein
MSVLVIGSMRDHAAQLIQLVEEAANCAAQGHDIHAAYLLGKVQIVAEVISRGAQAAEQELRTTDA